MNDKNKNDYHIEIDNKVDNERIHGNLYNSLIRDVYSEEKTEKYL